MWMRRLFDFPYQGSRSPFEELDRMRRQMERLSEAFRSTSPMPGFAAAGVFPSINLTEDKNNYYVRAELPGMKAADLDLQMTGKSLTISGERKIASEGENVKYHRREREAGKFSRVIGLPGDVDSEKVNAGITNGILTVAIPKAQPARSRQITIS